MLDEKCIFPPYTINLLLEGPQNVILGRLFNLSQEFEQVSTKMDFANQLLRNDFNCISFQFSCFITDILDCFV